MKTVKKIAIALAGAIALVLPLGLGAVAHAESDQTPTEFLRCDGGGEVDFSDITEGCDLSVDKQVNVNGGTYYEADTSADAVQATIGDTVTWKITVSNLSEEGLTPWGTVTLSDVLPSGATYVSSDASAGTYDPSSGDWTFDIENNLPATLTITSTANSTGLFQNVANLSTIDACDDGCDGIYADSNSSNNSDDAWMDPSAKPAVLADSTTLANTGSSPMPSMIAGGMIAAALGTVFLGRKRSQNLDR